VISTATTPHERPGAAAGALRSPLVDIVVPVHNEQAGLERSIRRLHSFLQANMPFAWRIVIADNASTDDTLAVARSLSFELTRTRVLHLSAKGRGRALRRAWSESNADVLCYMDVDLSTDLRALLPLIAGLVSGHSDVAIGTRLARGSRVIRGHKREFISRSYNRLLRLVLGARFSDAQCGFKAIRADVAAMLLPDVEDDGWFFDTELLVLAQRRGLRIHEVAVDWVDDPDSRVDIVSTAAGDLRGVARLLVQAPLARFLMIGVVSTVAYAALYVLLRPWLGPGLSNALALAVTAVANTQANRYFTFGLRGPEGIVRQHAGGALVYLLALGLTLGALDALQAIDPRPARAVEVTVLVVASALATVSRYVALRTWVFARRVRRPASLRAIPHGSPTPGAPAMSTTALPSPHRRSPAGPHARSQLPSASS
jgi:putative flippase GtrA